jgi:hypothetical protein
MPSTWAFMDVIWQRRVYFKYLAQHHQDGALEDQTPDGSVESEKETERGDG